ncbi:hypothetical protein BJ165DRAFT_1138732 [Panaeolus papilionaceus]|nr:hypothetical protein BJ165DRAFT_1138732 [Panaeolus papilionaceus]
MEVLLHKGDGSRDGEQDSGVPLLDLDGSDADNKRKYRPLGRCTDHSLPSIRRSSSHPPLPQVRESPEPDPDLLSASTPPPPPRPGLIATSKSHGSLESMSSRFMTSLLSSSHPSPASTSPTHHRSLDTLFANNRTIDPMASLHPLSPKELVHASSIPTPSSTTRKTPSPKTSHPTSPSIFDPSISHGTPLGVLGFQAIANGIEAY